MLDQFADEPSAPHQASLLSCPKCRAPCPLGFGETTVCPACQTVLPLSQQQKDERQARRESHDERRAQDGCFQRALRARVRLWRAPLFLTLVSFLAPFLAAVFGYFLGYREGNYPKAGYIWLTGIGVMHFLTSLLLESRKEEQLQALLRARPPAQAGGPPVCRVCAAPLSVPVEGDPVPAVRDLSCDHCGADNILTSGGDIISTAPRPDLLDAEAVYKDVYGDQLDQRASRLYPLTILLGFLMLAVLIYYAVKAPSQPLQ